MPEIIYSHKNNMKRKSPRQSQNQIQRILFFFIIIAIISLVYIQLDRQIIPTVIAMAKIRAHSVATKAVNEGITETLVTHKTTMSDLISYDYDDLGELVSWNVDSIVINNLCAGISEKATDKLQDIGIVKFKIPLGNAMGSTLFANLGPEIGIDILPLGTVEVNYDNAIRSTGINQVNHTVWLDVKATVQVVVPLFSEQVIVQRKVVLIDKVLSGTVPPNYVSVPEKDVLEVAPNDVLIP